MYYTKHSHWFRIVEGSSLVVGKKYLVNGMFMGKYSFSIRLGEQRFRYFELSPFYTHEYSDMNIFYEWIPSNAQEKMERRALSMILQHILGDPYFVW